MYVKLWTKHRKSKEMKQKKPKQCIEAVPEGAQMWYFLDKEFKSGILNSCKEWKETIF